MYLSYLNDPLIIDPILWLTKRFWKNHIFSRKNLKYEEVFAFLLGNMWAESCQKVPVLLNIVLLKVLF